jgi:hypothetical protein
MGKSVHARIETAERESGDAKADRRFMRESPGPPGLLRSAR